MNRREQKKRSFMTHYGTGAGGGLLSNEQVVVFADRLAASSHWMVRDYGRRAKEAIDRKEWKEARELVNLGLSMGPS